MLVSSQFSILTQSLGIFSEAEVLRKVNLGLWRWMQTSKLWFMNQEIKCSLFCQGLNESILKCFD